jgi:hypothetical protein
LHKQSDSSDESENFDRRLFDVNVYRKIWVDWNAVTVNLCRRSPTSIVVTFGIFSQAADETCIGNSLLLQLSLGRGARRSKPASSSILPRASCRPSALSRNQINSSTCGWPGTPASPPAVSISSRHRGMENASARAKFHIKFGSVVYKHLRNLKIGVLDDYKVGYPGDHS